MADEKKGGRKPDEGGKSGRSDKSRQPTRGRGKGPPVRCPANARSNKW